MSAAWHRAIAWALVGEELDLGVQDLPDPQELAAQLATRGWTPERVRARALAAHDEQAWPFPVPDAVRSGLGAAQLHAAIAAARAHFGLQVFEVRPPSRRTTLDADERRLMSDVPPHFGRT